MPVDWESAPASFRHGPRAQILQNTIAMKQTLFNGFPKSSKNIRDILNMFINVKIGGGGIALLGCGSQNAPKGPEGEI